MEHPDPEVRAALTRLLDALCSWERERADAYAASLRDQYGARLLSLTVESRAVGPWREVASA